MATDVESSIEYGSDAIALQLSRLGFEYVAMVPGSTYKGLHDSLVNFDFGTGTRPELLVCLHEEHPVHIAQGYAKVANKPMAVSVHANVGLMHAIMAIYNAFCDRVPMLILGATGPLDSYRRRPWIDWVHTSLDQAALIRPFIKWDDQPLSPNAAIRAVLQATSITASKPCAPTYVCLDSAMQEAKVNPADIHLPDTGRRLASLKPPGPSTMDVKLVSEAIARAKQPLFMMGRMRASPGSWRERIALVESLPHAKVLTDLKQIAPFPTWHKQQPAPPGVSLSEVGGDLIRSSDLLIALDWVDLAGTLSAAHGGPQVVEPVMTIVQVSLDAALHNGWSQDHFSQPPVDIAVQSDPDIFVSTLLQEIEKLPAVPTLPAIMVYPNGVMKPVQGGGDRRDKTIFMHDLSSSLYSALSPDEICLVRIPLSWTGEEVRATHPFSFLGWDSGGRLASGPANVIGAALALQKVQPSLHAVAVVGDGDFLMGCTALWTASRYRIPLLVVVANNHSFFNDEVHQERVATARSRPVENKWIGMRLDDPAPDVSSPAKSLGCTVVRSSIVDSVHELLPALHDAATELKNGKTVVLDVHVSPTGYRTALEKGVPAGQSVV
ncbi:hypothetical protein M409DRAFT_55247 [Zasmidium cellare ATCC 36951]|uniref:Pyruvate decarboxylase n=1 Tax=Zasmidium cellare ATCC 36951 TaxID=1080233 RepID=A0A6A6CI55_ZASCE|nr:uncharacterized protein M409DRAFT_55247 [Zasmidium cellare ATCC 36951]KAF2165868.1 hypothetical protein M409DRAFT_55247 [Zasmidium cellare ATCC 36951]